MIDGRTYSWLWLCEIRRRQLDAWKAARPQQPALFDLKDDSRPAWEHNAAPSLLASGVRFLFWFHPATPLGKRKRAAATLP